MPYEFYKVLHILGVLLTFSGFAFLVGAQIGGVSNPPSALRKFSSIFHGIGLLLVLVAGFGLLARLQLAREMPLWSYLKMGLWVILAGSLFLFKRKPKLSLALYSVCLIIGGLASYLAVNKPLQ